ncbi:hypothetical protein Salat_1868700 [Sesamum alatum]|uniref:RNase H type-1 domain-containing protein n=1 Tax=Sesamum alatum TaxID=300844 RepID=A0AAE1Y331_9LAMI|nr:hypothetical protein Salat_1868700 [Sesamum alatum]
MGASAGVVIRNAYGDYVDWKVAFWSHILERDCAEVLAARFAVEVAGNYQGQRLEFQNGCAKVVSLLTIKRGWVGSIAPIISDILALMQASVDGCFTCIPKGGNQVAWLLAKHATVGAADGMMPPCVVGALAMDKLGIGTSGI